MAPVDVLLTPEELLRRAWTFGVRGQPPQARYVRLLADGRIAGFDPGNVNEKRWRLDEGRLRFLDAWDRVTTAFDEAGADADGRLALHGDFRMPPEGVPHTLQEIPVLEVLAPPEGGPHLERRTNTPRRRNLVVLRGNETSLHHQWRRDMVDEDRNWDLLVSFYGDPALFDAPDFAEYRILQPKKRKFAPIHDLFHEGSPLWAYDHIFFPDDDLMMTWRDVNEMFAICRDYKLQLAQPALDQSGFITHPITGRQWPFILRFTSFVEVMAPIFSSDALRACVATFKDSAGDFGLDNTWPKLLGDPRTGVAVIDKTPIVHTRPAGGAYDIGGALREGDELQRRYDAHNRHIEYGHILLQPLNRTNRW